MNQPTQIFSRRSHSRSFSNRILAIVANIPKGSVLTYKQVATKAGNPKAARAVGAILKTNYDPKIPCHRVIRSDGKTGGYNRGSLKKIRILKEEGVRFDR
jgi:O-6-methylguanine DNA methyltransferase